MHRGDSGHPSFSPESILQRIRAGDKAAEESLVAYYQRQLIIILFQRCHDPELAADLSQDAFMIVLDKAREDKIDNPQALGAFIRQVGTNLLTAHYRKETRRKTDPNEAIDTEFAQQDSNPADKVLDTDLTNIVIQLMDELPTDRDRDLLRRHFVYNESKATICNEYGLTTAHFDRVIHRARQRLKQLLEHKLGHEVEQFDIRWLFAVTLFSVVFYSLSENNTSKNPFFTQQVGGSAASGDFNSVPTRQASHPKGCGIHCRRT